jgi:rhodanese-related sulfurtransferase
MKKILLAISVLMGLLITGCTSTNNNANSNQQIVEEVAKYKILNDEDVDMFLKREDVGIIDARTKAEFQGGTLDSRAILIEVQKGAKSKESIANLDGELEKLDKTKTWIVYCAKGPRSKGLAEKMTNLGFEDVYVVEGGIVGYNKSKK